jgi:hypothetical protein
MRPVLRGASFNIGQMIHLTLAGMVDTATDPRALAVLIVGLLASVAVAVGPPVRDFVRRMPAYARALRSEAIETARHPKRARASAAAIARLPRAAISYGLIGLALAGWAAYAFTQPATETPAVERTQLEHVTSIGYVARGAPSVALPDGMVSPVSAESVARTGGQPPLYSAVLSKIDFGFRYEMRSTEPLEVLGFGGTALRIKAQDGWERTIVLQPAQLLAGPRVTMWFTVDLDAVRLVIAGVEFATGSKSEWYDLTVIPVVRLAGQQAGAHIDETYSREFNLRYDRVRITPDATLEQVERKTHSTRVEAPRHVRAFGIAMEWGFARWAAGIGAIVALGGAALLVLSRPHVGAASASTTGALPAPAAAKVKRPAEALIANDAPAAPMLASPSVSAPSPASAAPAMASAREASNSTANAEADALLAASVEPGANGAAPHIAHPAPPDADERASIQEPPAA